MESSAGNTQYRSNGADPYPMNYSVPNLGVDSDIIASTTNMKNAEAKIGTWTVKEKTLIQLDEFPSAHAQSIPACDSASFPDCLKAETAGVWKL